MSWSVPQAKQRRPVSAGLSLAMVVGSRSMTKNDEPDKPDEGSALSSAAAALEVELRRFEQLGQLARKIELNSERNLEKAARATQEAAESQQRVAQHVRDLVSA